MAWVWKWALGHFWVHDEMRKSLGASTWRRVSVKASKSPANWRFLQQCVQVDSKKTTMHRILESKDYRPTSIRRESFGCRDFLPGFIGPLNPPMDSLTKGRLCDFHVMVSACIFYLGLLSLKAGSSRINGWRQGNARIIVRAHYYRKRLTDISVWIRNHIHSFMWHVITHPWRFHHTLIDVEARLNNYITSLLQPESVDL